MDYEMNGTKQVHSQNLRYLPFLLEYEEEYLEGNYSLEESVDEFKRVIVK